MKRMFAITGALFVLTVLNAQSQQSGTAPSPAVPPSQPTPPTAPGQNAITPPGTTTLPPGFDRNPLPPNIAARTNRFVGVTNQLAIATNDFGTATNQFGFGATNRFVATNRFGIFTNRFGISPTATNPGQLTPTGAATNRFLATTNTIALTNNFAFTNTLGAGLQDQAFSEADRTLLVQVQQTVQAQMSVIAGTPIRPGAWSPIHFVVRGSIVTLIGFVTTMEERQQLAAVVQGVPGVTQVVDNLQIRPIDQGFNDADRALLTQIRATLQPIIKTESSTPIRMVARDGMVTLVGFVPTTEQQQQIETVIAGVPGVVRVSNRLTVNPNFQNANPETPFLRQGVVGTNQSGLLPTSRATGQNRILGTNVSPKVNQTP